VEHPVLDAKRQALRRRNRPILHRTPYAHLRSVQAGPRALRLICVGGHDDVRRHHVCQFDQRCAHRRRNAQPTDTDQACGGPDHLPAQPHPRAQGRSPCDCRLRHASRPPDTGGADRELFAYVQCTILLDRRTPRRRLWPRFRRSRHRAPRRRRVRTLPFGGIRPSPELPVQDCRLDPPTHPI